jgi:hypothetical protein
MVKKIKTEQAQTERMRTTILRRANEIICKDRNATHGEPEDSFSTIAAYWSLYLTKETGRAVHLTRQDVAQMMVLFKVSRIHDNSEHVDNWLDQAGYTALGAEMAAMEMVQNKAAELAP